MAVIPAVALSTSATQLVRPLRVGVLGYGYWGPNLARNIASSVESELVAVADLDTRRLGAARQAHPVASLTTQFGEVLCDPAIDAVVIATPPSTHHALVREALQRGKHVLVTKPLATSVADAEDLVATARQADRVLAVDHTFLFTGAVRRMKEYIDAGELGDLYYFDSIRINLGLFQHDANVIWDLAPHDISIMLHLINQPVTSISAVGVCHVDSFVENIAYLTVRFEGPLLAHFHVNWLAPAKVRTLIIGGSRKMLVYDDVEASEKLKVYDSGARLTSSPEDVYRSMVEYRTGDIVCPKIDKTEALTNEWAHFVEVCRGHEDTISGAELGLKVVKLIAAAQRSLRLNGAPVEVAL
jgi:predicted dehydrogenase